MLYLIGGAGRSGKSMAARNLFLEKQIPFISIDFLMMGFTNGLPHLGIDANKTEMENTHLIWPFIKAMAVCLIENGEDYIIEGVYLLPSQVNELIEVYPDDVTACFIGYSRHTKANKLKEVRKFNTGCSDWTNTETDQYILTTIERMIGFSKFLQAECEKYNIEYFDSTDEFLQVNREVVDYLKRAAKEDNADA